jgi:hypothetical protein
VKPPAGGWLLGERPFCDEKFTAINPLPQLQQQQQKANPYKKKLSSRCGLCKYFMVFSSNFDFRFSLNKTIK